MLGTRILEAHSVFNASLMKYAEERANWQLVFCAEASVKTFRFLRKLDCDGAIVRIVSPELRKEALRIGYPLVNISSWLEDPGVPSVRCDEAALGSISAQHLLEKGFRRIGVVRFSHGGWFVDARIAAFLETIRGAGLAGAVSQFEAPFQSLAQEDIGLIAKVSSQG